MSKGPLLIDPLDLNVQITHSIQYNLSPVEKKHFKGMTAEEAVDMTYAQSVRSNVCMAYVVGTQSSIIVEELRIAQQDLEAALKTNKELLRHLEEVYKATKDERKKAAIALTEAQNSNRLLQSSNVDLKLHLQRTSEKTWSRKGITS